MGSNHEEEYQMITLPEKGICAHRGGMGTHPESTLAAFRESIRLGVHMIEFDVRRSRDGRLFLSHDFTLERLTGQKESPEEWTLAELKAIDVGGCTGPRFAGERIATLEEMLTIMPVNVWMLFHLWSGDMKLAREVARVIFRQGRQHQAVLATSADRIEAARKVCPDILTANMRDQPNTSEYVSESMALHVDFVRFWSRRWSDRPLETALIDRAKAAGMRVVYYEPDAPEELAHLYEMGIDFPIVESIEEMMKAAQRLGLEPLEPIFGHTQ